MLLLPIGVYVYLKKHERLIILSVHTYLNWKQTYLSVFWTDEDKEC